MKIPSDILFTAFTKDLPICSFSLPSFYQQVKIIIKQFILTKYLFALFIRHFMFLPWLLGLIWFLTLLSFISFIVGFCGFSIFKARPCPFIQILYRFYPNLIQTVPRYTYFILWNTLVGWNKRECRNLFSLIWKLKQTFWLDFFDLFIEMKKH